MVTVPVSLAAVWRWRALAAVLASALAVGLTIGMAVPLVSLALAAQGHGDLVIGLVAGSYALAILGVGPLVPRLAARAGAVPVACAGIAVTAAALAAMPFVPGLAPWLGLRLLMGVGVVLHWVVSETWINALAGPADRGRTVAVYAAVWGAGIASGPLLLHWVGTVGTLPFLTAAGILTLALPPVLAARRLMPSLEGAPAGGGLVLALRAAPLALAAGLLCGVVEATALSLLPLYGIVRGLSAETAVVLAGTFGAGAILLQPPTGWLADRFGPERLLRVMGVIALGCTLLMDPALAEGWPVWPVAFAWGGAVAGLYMLALVLIGRRFSGGGLAAANAGLIMAYTLGSMAGPPTAGAVTELWPPHGLLVVLAAATVVFLVAAIARRY